MGKRSGGKNMREEIMVSMVKGALDKRKAVLHKLFCFCLLAVCLLFTACGRGDVSDILERVVELDSVTEVPDTEDAASETGTGKGNGKGAVSLKELPEYSGEPYCEVNGNRPEFPKKEKTRKSFEQYSELDSLGRCGVAYANIGRELMPAGERGSIRRISPTGWHSVKYDTVDGKYLYNRCHLIGYQLTAENDNEKNLITGTRYMNVEGMLPFEDMVADYVRETDHHVLYRVTPVFRGKNLLAEGVQMEAYSVEDKGQGICFNVFVYNVQPGISIDYATGDSRKENGRSTAGKDAGEASVPQEGSSGEHEAASSRTDQTEIRGNQRSRIYHCPGQAAYEEMKDSDYLVVFRSEQEAQAAGYRKAKR